MSLKTQAGHARLRIGALQLVSEPYFSGSETLL